jgi:hypothetical protein
MSKIFEISDKEYQEKKFEVAKTLLPAMTDKQTEAFLIDKRKRGSLIFNCVAISDHLLQELGYQIKGKSSVDGDQDKVGIRNLNEMLKKKS